MGVWIDCCPPHSSRGGCCPSTDKMKEVTGVRFSISNPNLVYNSCRDGSVRVWDLRNIRHPVSKFVGEGTERKGGGGHRPPPPFYSVICFFAIGFLPFLLFFFALVNTFLSCILSPALCAVDCCLWLSLMVKGGR